MEFPDGFLSKLVSDNTKDGNVIFVYCYDLKGQQKQKFLVIFSKSTCATKYGCILINSSDYSNLHSSHIIRAQQIPALSKAYDFLSHDSFFDCSEIKERKASEIDNILKQQPNRMIGKINDEDHSFICRALARNPMISNKIKKLYKLIK